MHTQELQIVTPQWFSYLEKRGSLKVGNLVYRNPNQTFTTKTLAMAIIAAVVLGVACACGFDLTSQAIKAIFGR